MLLGCPGAGKGTQAQYIIDAFNIPQISTGEMLRNAIQNKTALGEKVKLIMDKGELVPDDIIIDLVKARISEPDCLNGFILDGFPRTLKQANALEQQGINLDLVIEIAVPDQVIIERMSGRLIHPASGRVFHKVYNPPKEANTDDITGEPLIQRSDDNEETVRQRLSIYHEQTEPLVTFYQHKSTSDINSIFKKIDGTQTVAEIQKQIHDLILYIKKEKIA